MEHQELPARFIRQVGEFVEDVIDEAVDQRVDPRIEARLEDHEERMHVPPRRRDPLRAVPFAAERLDDAKLSRIIEILRIEPEATLETVSRSMGIPMELLERELADWKPRWRTFLLRRSVG